MNTPPITTPATGTGRPTFSLHDVSLLQPDEIRSARRELKRRRTRSLLLVVPLLAFIFFTFLAPITTMLYRSVYNPAVAELIPHTIEALSGWDGQDLPPPATLSSMATELKQLGDNRKAGVLAAAINRSYPGASSMVNSSARQLRRATEAQLAQSGDQLLLAAHPAWANPKVWQSVQDVGRIYTDTHYLTALDRERDADGNIQQRESARIYIQLYTKTLGMALTITLLCIALGYPLSYYLAKAPRKTASLLMVLVLLPFWTSLLVRTTAWIALLQTNGVVNSTLTAIGVLNEPLELLYTRHATIISMTHILLPFMILPLYSVMRGIDPSYMRAAISMGSRPFPAFVRIFFPLTLPGLSAGALLVFIISVGYYITPALVGGTDGQMISNIIAFHMQQSNNWGLAAALGTLLLVLILLLYWVYDRLVGAGSIKLG